MILNAHNKEELERHGKQIIFRTITQKSKKVYNRVSLSLCPEYSEEALYSEAAVREKGL